MSFDGMSFGVLIHDLNILSSLVVRLANAGRITTTHVIYLVITSRHFI